MEHLDLAFCWLRGTVEASLITVDYILTTWMTADILMVFAHFLCIVTAAFHSYCIYHETPVL
jgi:hypothetical protein